MKGNRRIQLEAFTLTLIDSSLGLNWTLYTLLDNLISLAVNIGEKYSIRRGRLHGTFILKLSNKSKCVTGIPTKNIGVIPFHIGATGAALEM